MRETELFAMLEGTADAVFVVDQGGLIRFWNPSAERLYGLRSADVVDRHCACVIGGADAAGARVCTPNCAVLEIMRSGSEIPAYDLEVNTASGARRWVNVSIIVAKAGPRGERLAIHLVRDIDARKKLENLTQEIAVRVGQLTGRQAEELVKPARNSAPAVPLTARERRILQLLSLGRSTAAVGRELEISPATVRNHIQHILRKLGTHSRLEAVMRAAAAGLI